MKEKNEVNDKLTGAQKVAIVLLSVNHDTALKIFGSLDEDEISEVSYAMANMGVVDNTVVSNVLDEFKNEFENSYAVLGNIETTEKILSKILSEEQLQKVLDQIKGPKGKNTWEKLANVNEEMLAGYLSNEHPQVATLIISKIPTDQAAKVLKNMPDSLSFDIISRLLNLSSVKSEVVGAVENVIKSEFVSISSKSKKQNIFSSIASILNSLDRDTEEKYISYIESKFPESASRIKNLMFTFNDLIKIDINGIQLLLRNIDKSVLPLALKGAPEEIKQLFFSSISQRQSRIIQEEIESMVRVRVKDVHNAQSQIVTKAKELIATGELDLVDSAEESKYI